MKKVITTLDGSKFITNRFGKIELTDNINIAYVYSENDNHIVAQASSALSVNLKMDDLNKYYSPLSF